MTFQHRFLLGLFLVGVAACSADGKPSFGIAGTTISYGSLAEGFYALPYPNDLRYDTATHTIDLHDFPNPKNNAAVAQIVALAGERRSGFGLLPVVTFPFNGPLAWKTLPSDVNSTPAEPYTLFFVNIDAASPRYGEVIPAIAQGFAEAGPYTPANLLTMAPWPGLMLAPRAKHAALVLRSLGDDAGHPLGQSATLGAALAGDQTAGALRSLFAPLAAFLKTHDGLAADDIAGATIFTTGDPVADMAALVTDATSRFSARVSQAFTLVHQEAAFCAFEGRVTFPQFQTGEAPYPAADEGRVAVDESGRLVAQRDEDVRVVITIPTGAMPAKGFPTLHYTHGSGGIASEMIDRGRVTVVDGPEEPWRGPAYHAALRGYAAIGAAMPISPDRVPGAESFDYLQLTNLTSLAGNFQQGVIETALLRRLLYALTLEAAACPGVTTGGAPIKFDTALHVDMGQSMGAMYTNLYGAIATDTAALIPTGAGGYWSFFLFGSEIVPDAENVLKLFLGVPGEATLNHLHPILGLFQQYAEAVDPVVFVPRIVRDPLPGVPSKHLYVPYGYVDKYFTKWTQRAMALGYAIPVAYPSEDQEMLTQLIAFGLIDVKTLCAVTPGLATCRMELEEYPISTNFVAGDGKKLTAIGVQFPEDPIQQNGHTIYAQRDEVIYQYECFLASLIRDGIPTVPAPSTMLPQPACP